MGRPREFDEPAALDAAMDCFWRQGYEATSVRDLAAQMGISGTSLYNAFGDKRSLFRDVLNRYAERSTRERIARLEAALPPKEAIRAFLGEIVERALDADRRGCLLVNTTLEIARHDPEVGAVVAQRFDEIEAFFRRVHEMGLWLEIVTLLIPGFNDSKDEIRKLTEFLAGISRDIPWHVTAFHTD